MHPGRHAEKFPDKAAVVMAETGERVSYRELDERANRLAQLLFDAGLRRGDHLALFVENHPRFFEVYWAAARSGLYFTPVNRYLGAEEAAYIVRDCGAKALITSAGMGDVATQMLPELGACELRLMVDGVRDGYQSYEDAVAAFPPTPPPEPSVGQAMLYSSGTTGRPKGIWRPLPERDVDAPNPLPLLLGEFFSMGEDTVYLSPAPLYHAAPLGYTTAMQVLGATAVVMERFDAAGALDSIETHGVSHSQWVPTMFTRLLRLPERERSRRDLSSHRVAIHAAAPCPPDLKRRMIEWWGPILFEYYAATEGNGLTLIDSREWLEREGSVGRAVHGTIHICDDEGRELPPGEDGLIYFEQASLPFRYHGDDAKTKSAQHPAHPAWSALGDIGHLDEEGYLYLTDRKSFMIISGGVNIYPAEIENALAAHPAVLDVAVIGVPNAEFGEEVKAVVQPGEGTPGTPELAAELIEHCRSRLAHYKCPRSVDFEAELPRLPTGKLLKRQLRDRYWGGSGTKIG